MASACLPIFFSSICIYVPPPNHYPWAYPFFYNQNKAFYAFNNGVGVVSSSSQMTYDCTAQTLIYTHNSNDTLLNEAKAYLQWSYQDYLDR